ncbi:MAG: WXG100 family type VII secretion target, partial [Chloroflexota bacterium]
AATRLGELHAQAQDVLNKVSNPRQNLSGQWVGFGYDSFASEMDEDILPALKRLIAALENGQTQMTTVARQFEETERTDAVQINAIQAPSLITG